MVISASLMLAHIPCAISDIHQPDPALSECFCGCQKKLAAPQVSWQTACVAPNGETKHVTPCDSLSACSSDALHCHLTTHRPVQLTNTCLLDDLLLLNQESTDDPVGNNDKINKLNPSSQQLPQIPHLSRTTAWERWPPYAR